MKMKITIIVLLIINTLSVVAQKSSQATEIYQGMFFKYGELNRQESIDTTTTIISIDSTITIQGPLCSEREIRRQEKKAEKHNNKLAKNGARNFKPTYRKFNKTYAKYKEKGKCTFIVDDKSWQEAFDYNMHIMKTVLDSMYTTDSLHTKIIKEKKGGYPVVGLVGYLSTITELMSKGKIENSEDWTNIPQEKMKENLTIVFINLDYIVDYLINGWHDE
jgi:sensor c-di-GMP phosphodiesterase-like protein